MVGPNEQISDTEMTVRNYIVADKNPYRRDYVYKRNT
jgi:hypothetical protein